MTQIRPILPDTQKIKKEFFLLNGNLEGSFKWLIDRYDEKCKSLSFYAEREDHNKKYLLSEMAFLISLYKNLENVNRKEIFISNLLNELAGSNKTICILIDLLTFHNVHKLEIEKYLNTPELLQIHFNDNLRHGKERE